MSNLNVSANDLVMVIGEKEIQIRLLTEQLTQAYQKIEELTPKPVEDAKPTKTVKAKE